MSCNVQFGGNCTPDMGPLNEQLAASRFVQGADLELMFVARIVLGNLQDRYIRYNCYTEGCKEYKGTQL